MKSTGQRLHTRDPRVAFEKWVIRQAGCWGWKGATHPLGYGQLSVAGKVRFGHRIAYELYRGPIAPGLEIDHLCRNAVCSNPDHLEAVTHAENLRRGVGWAGVNARKTECVNGHPFTAENTYVYPNGLHRKCRACDHGRKVAKRKGPEARRAAALKANSVRWGTA